MPSKRLLDLFCGRWGWSRAFAARGWDCTGIDWKLPPEVPERCTFIQADITAMKFDDYGLWLNGNKLQPDFICASSPCEQFSVHCMKFLKKKNPPYPDMGIKLFNHTRQLCEESGIPYIMENVRCAEQYVGKAVHHANAFYLWGNAVPPLLPKGFIKMGNQGGYYKKSAPGGYQHDPPGSRQSAAKSATIPMELANAVASYAERILEAK